MADKFANKIKDLEARILRLKTLGLKSSSSLAATSQNITMPNGKQFVDVVVSTSQATLLAAYIVSPTTLDKDKGVVVRFKTDWYGRSIVSLGVFSGYNLDGITVKITATSTFSYTLEYP